MRSRREPAHIDADLRDDGLCAEVLDAGNRHYEVDCGAKGPKVRLHLRVDRGHGGVESVDLIEMQAQQEANGASSPGREGPRGTPPVTLLPVDRRGSPVWRDWFRRQSVPRAWRGRSCPSNR